MPKLSICIPTYKRSAMLAELLDSIIAQGIPDIEVIVSDDASPDDTVAVAESYKGKIANYTFIAQPQNLGLDRNFLAVVEAATGDFIWLMGDDDRLEPGGARRVLDALERWPDIVGMTLGVIDYDVTMKTVTGIRAMPDTQRMATVGDVFSRMPEVLGFMSALVIDRRKWKEVAAEPETAKFQNYYVQVYIIGQVIKRFGPWGVVKEPCVGFRSGNDQFHSKFGWWKRLEIDVDAYEQIGDALLADDPDGHKAYRRRIFKAHVMARIYNAKTRPGPTGDILNVAKSLYPTYKDLPEYWSRALPFLFAPCWTIRALRSGYKRFGKSGAARGRQLAKAA